MFAIFFVKPRKGVLKRKGWNIFWDQMTQSLEGRNLLVNVKRGRMVWYWLKHWQIHWTMNHQQNKYIWYPERGISNTYDTLKGIFQIYSKYISGSAEKERVAWFEWIYSEYWKYSDKVPPTKHEHYVYRVQLVVSKRDLQITDEARNSPFICWRATVFMEDASHVTSSTYHLPANCHTPTCLHLNIHNGQ